MPRVSLLSRGLALLTISALASSFANEEIAAKPLPPKPAKAAGHPVKPKPKPAEAKKDGKKDEKEKFADEKTFDEVTKNMDVIKGLFTFWRKADENKIYLEIATNQFDTTFIFSATIDQNAGERGLYSSQMAGESPFQLKLVGKSVQMLIPNSRYTATNGAPTARATSRSFPVSLLASARVISRPHPERKSILINAADLFVNDLPGLAPVLKEAYKPSDYRFDRSNSSFASVKSFPENALVEMWLHYVSDNPRTPSLTLPDARSLPIVVKYDLSALKETGYKPRLADDRVGHFLSVQADFTSDHPKSIMIRRINRWNLEKTDPKAALSPVKKPIVFWLENTIPEEYRPAMREGVLLWNKAFERVGFKDAVVVKQMPDDADWDPADSRYNTIRWFVGVDASFAIGPSRANPFTGEIYDADIGFSEGIVRSIRRQGEEFISPILPPGQEPPTLPKLAWTRDDYHLCTHADGLAHQAAFGASVLQARGALSPETEQRLLREYLMEVTAHEVGHTLGLRHNFRASNMLKPGELHDTSKVQSSSVMDYNPIVLAAKGEKQGNFVPVDLGPYDYLAIEYAYKPIDGDERAELAKIAARASANELSFSTDEDALGTYAAGAIDPMVNQWDQSSDPIAFFQSRVGIVRELWENMEGKLLVEGEGYQVLRRAMSRSVNEYFRAAMIASKFIGGIYHYRDHFGDPNGRAPYAPVAADKQREALAFLKKHTFSEDAFELPRTLHNRLAAERLPGLNGIGGLANEARVDYPWHDTALNIQRGALARLFAPVTLSRLLDNQVRFAANEHVFTMADMFAGLDESIWSELDHPVSEIKPLRRNLQREHLKTLIRLTLRSTPGLPEDATSLARASLNSLRGKIEKQLAGSDLKDTTSRAHLAETSDRIKAAIDAQLTKSLD